MRDLLAQIEGSLESEFYYLSLMSALAVPDIAGALDSEDGRANRSRYAAWFEEYVRPQFARRTLAALPAEVRDSVANSIENPLSGEACYRFRCSMLHQGTTHHPKSEFSRILFVEPGATSNTFHYNVLNDALNIDWPSFCREVIAGALDWLEAVEETTKFQRNYDRFVRRYPEGLKPYIVGVPVVG